MSKRVRSAISGKFVNKEKAKSDPTTTVVEKVKKKGK
jgi:hypothetical protein